MWCFIKLGSLLRRHCDQVEKPNWLQVDRKGIAVKLQKGVTSQLVLCSKTGERLRLVYNPRESSPTGNWFPDNMLEITKAGNRRAYHYIFDAKYRFADDGDYIDRFGAPGPPEDAINRMHAYRDQIVYGQLSSANPVNSDQTIWDQGQRPFIQKSVAAFVLYPNARPDAEENKFFTSISKVGVGGLPFLPERTDLVNGVLDQLLKRTSETEEDRAIELGSEDERQRIKQSLEYGFMGIIASPEQLEFIRKHRIYHMPYAELQGVRLRADFIVIFQSKTQFGKEAGVRYWAPVRNFKVGQRSQIKPQPPGIGRSLGLYAWFELGMICEREAVLPPNESGHPQYFRVTTRLAFEEARTLDELSLVREPERRLYRELVAAGLRVQLREDRPSGQPAYDIADLHLRFDVFDANEQKVRIRFDPANGAFLGENQEWFRFEDLMFDAERCMQRVRNGLMGH